MSLANPPVGVVKVVEPRLDFKPYKVVVEPGAKNIVAQKLPNLSVGSTSGQSYQFQVPGNTIISSKIGIQNTFKLNFTGLSTASGQYLINVGTQDAPSSFPFLSYVDSMTATLNGKSIQFPFCRSSFSLLKHASGQEVGESLIDVVDSCPATYDNCAKFSDWASGQHNVLGDGSNATRVWKPRGSVEMTITGGTNAVSTALGQTLSAEITFTTVEYIPFSPFTMTHDEGLANLDSLQFQFNYGTDITRVWSHSDAGLAFATATLSISASSLLLTRLEPNVFESVPQTQILDHWGVSAQSTTGGSSTATNTACTITSQQIGYNYVPDKLFICIRKDPSTITWTDPEWFFALSNVSIQVNNQSNILAQYTPYDLYQMSKKNGSDQTWSDFCGRISKAGASVGSAGSVLIVSAQDLELSEGLVGGSGGLNCTITVTATGYNYSGSTVASPQLVVIPQSVGVLAIGDHTISESLNCITTEDVLGVKTVVSVSTEGGSLYGKKRHLVGKALSGGAMSGGSAGAGLVEQVKAATKKHLRTHPA